MSLFERVESYVSTDAFIKYFDVSTWHLRSWNVSISRGRLNSDVKMPKVKQVAKLSLHKFATCLELSVTNLAPFSLYY